MANTVGSYKNIHWQKKWIPIKSQLSLSKEQRQLIIGSLFGDGTMYIGRKGVNANFKVEHCLNQREYVEWKYKILKNWVFTEPKLSYRYGDEGERYPKSWWFRTIRHPLLTEIHDKFYSGTSYRDRKKKVPGDLGRELGPLALAVWVMDDGHYSGKRIDISTYAFSLTDVDSIQTIFRETFGLKSKYYRDRDKGYRMFFDQINTAKLIRIIFPFIVPSMIYKVTP